MLLPKHSLFRWQTLFVYKIFYTSREVATRTLCHDAADERRSREHRNGCSSIAELKAVSTELLGYIMHTLVREEMSDT